jgi:hypothetical protein
MSIERLPQELVDQICSDLHNEEDHYNASFLSPKFERTVTEKTPGRVLQYIESHKPVFQRRFRGLQHRSIKQVKFDIYTPEPRDSDDDLCSNVNIDERDERDMIFTAQIRDSFDTLSGMKKRAGVDNFASYKLDINSPYEELRGKYCCCVFHAKWHTRLLEPEKLPSLWSVRCLRIGDSAKGNVGRMKFEYRILIDLLHCLPNLESLECYIGCDEWTRGYVDNPAISFPADYVGLRRDRRHSLFEAISAIDVPNSLRRVNLDFIPFSYSGPGERSLPHHKAQPNLISPPVKDLFSTSLRILSSNLREMFLHAQVDEGLFWPEDNSSPTWPHLHRLFIKLHMVTPSGTWYFEGPGGEGRELQGYTLNEFAYPAENYEPEGYGEEMSCDPDSHGRSFEKMRASQFRIYPNEEILRPFLASFARAAANMPLCQV